jgi:hypothetical protein
MSNVFSILQLFTKYFFPKVWTPKTCVLNTDQLSYPYLQEQVSTNLYYKYSDTQQTSTLP